MEGSTAVWLAFAIVVLLIIIAVSAGKTKTSVQQTESVIRQQRADRDERLDPEWLSIQARLESDEHPPADIEMFFKRWNDGEWAGFEEVEDIDYADTFRDETPETRRKIRHVYFKAADKHDSWESFFNSNARNMTAEEVRAKHKLHLRLSDAEYEIFNKFQLGVPVDDYLALLKTDNLN